MKKKSVTSVFSMNDSSALPLMPSASNCDISIPSTSQDENIQKLSSENLELMKMEQNHQQQLQQKHQAYLQQHARQMAPAPFMNVTQQQNGFVVQSFVPYQHQPIMRPNIFPGQPILRPEFSHPFGRDVPGMKEVRSAPVPLMSCNGS